MLPWFWYDPPSPLFSNLTPKCQKPLVIIQSWKWDSSALLIASYSIQHPQMTLGNLLMTSPAGIQPLPLPFHPPTHAAIPKHVRLVSYDLWPLSSFPQPEKPSFHLSNRKIFSQWPLRSLNEELCTFTSCCESSIGWRAALNKRLLDTGMNLPLYIILYHAFWWKLILPWIHASQTVCWGAPRERQWTRQTQDILHVWGKHSRFPHLLAISWTTSSK